MQIDSQRSSSRRSQSRTSKAEYQSDPGYSQASSTCLSTDASTNFDKRSSRPTSFSIAARQVAQSFATCFTPFSSKDRQTDEEIDFSKASTSTAASKSRYTSDPNMKDGQKGNANFSIQEIIKATNNFSAANKIGEGHFGTIYKGKLRDGSVVAVKRAKKNAHERYASIEFKNEIKTLSKIEHLNLVRFLGYLEQDDERILVVEFVGNGNLREHLSGSRGRGLEIAERLQIAIDIAHAITYLHTYTDHPIIHRDIKASNILITEKLRVKVADFGFARLAAEEPDATHVVTQVRGTAGYLDPEYIKTYELTEKSDVYSFGVLLVELVTGRYPIEQNRQKEKMTTTWAMQKHKQRDTVMVMDPNLKRSPASITVVEKILDLARRCLAPSRRNRPSMRKCAEVLWEIRKDCQKLEVVNTSYSTHEGVNEIEMEEENKSYPSTRDSADEHEMTDRSSSSSSTNWGIKLVRSGAAWGMDTPAQRAENKAADIASPTMTIK